MRFKSRLTSYKLVPQSTYVAPYLDYESNPFEPSDTFEAFCGFLAETSVFEVPLFRPARKEALDVPYDGFSELYEYKYHRVNLEPFDMDGEDIII